MCIFHSSYAHATHYVRHASQLRVVNECVEGYQVPEEENQLVVVEVGFDIFGASEELDYPAMFPLVEVGFDIRGTLEEPDNDLIFS